MLGIRCVKKPALIANNEKSKEDFNKWIELDKKAKISIKLFTSSTELEQIKIVTLHQLAEKTKQKKFTKQKIPLLKF